MSEISETATKQAISMFTYLRELVELKTKTVRRIEEYENVLWFADVPKEQECYTPAWGAFRTEDDEVWLEIKKPKIKPFPPVPKDVQPWIREVDLANSSDIPDILTKIAVSENTEEINDAGIKETFIQLETQPHIRLQWDNYLKEKWSPWAQENERVKKIQNVYGTLHAIYQLQKKLGEAFEIVLGLGLLSWKTPSGQRVRRHLVVAQTSLDLDGRYGTLTVTSGAEGPKLAIEQGMLEENEKSPAFTADNPEELKNLGDVIWNNSDLNSLLQTRIHSVSAKGSYTDDLATPTSESESPVVSFSPALILRKRSERNLVSMFNGIVEQVKSGVELPFCIQRIVEVVDDHFASEKTNLIQTSILMIFRKFFSRFLQTTSKTKL